MSLLFSMYLWSFPICIYSLLSAHLCICLLFPPPDHLLCIRSVFVLQLTESTCKYAGVNIPISGCSATHILDIKILRLLEILKGLIITFFKNRGSNFIWNLHWTRRAELVLPTQVCLGPNMDSHIYTHMRIHTYGQLKTIQMYTPTRTYIHTYMYSHLPMCVPTCTYRAMSKYYHQ